MSLIIKELSHTHEWLEAFPVVKELRTHLDEHSYIDSIYAMKNEGYRMFALCNDEKITAVAGVIPLTNFYDGRHVYVYDLVTCSECRSKGYGEKLLEYVHQWGKDNGCTKVVLSSGLWRPDAHRFYEKKMGYEKVYYTFSKSLQQFL